MMSKLCHEISGQSFTPDFGPPSTLAFGDIPVEGVSEQQSRADHRHGMPPEPDPIESPTTCFYYEEMFPKSPINATKLKSTGTILFGDAGVTGVGDLPGVTGSFGHFQLDHSAGAIKGIGIQNFGTGTGLDASLQVHSFGRTRKFVTRVRASLVGALANVTTAIGAFRQSTASDITTITDGAYFYSVIDGTGAGNWHCICMDSGVATDVDTGRGWLTASGDGSYENFFILFDGVTVTFAIENLVYAQISTNVPLTNKIAAWMVMSFPTAVSPGLRRVVIDDLVFQGVR